MKHARLIAAAAAIALTAGMGRAQEVYDGANGNWNVDTWNTAANWNSGAGPVPSGTTDVVIQTGKHASTFNTVTPAYTGNLTLEANSILQIGQTSEVTALNVLGTGTITMNTGSDLTMRYQGNTVHPQNFAMAGDALYALGRSTSAHHRTRTLTGTFSGSGKLTLHFSNNNTLYLQGNSPSWSGGLTAPASENESRSSRIEAESANALGTGDVNIEDGLGLQIDAADAMGDTATLSLSGRPGSGVGGKKLVMNASDTIGQLDVDGFNYPSGTYGSIGSGADHEMSWIGGNSLLTVSSDSGDTTAPTVDIVVGASRVYYDWAPQLTYVLNFDKPVASSATTADFENIGSAPISIDSVAQTDSFTVNVVVSASGAGDLTLRIKSTAAIADLFGNPLAVPITDDATIIVTKAPNALVYEPFNDLDPTLNGNTPGIGLTGTWFASAAVQPETHSWGALPTSGNKSVYNNQYGGVLVDTTALNAKGLLDDGAELWFSVLVKTGSDIATNGDLGFAFGTERIGHLNNIPIQNSGTALGFTFKNNQLRASYWAPTLARSTTNSGNGASANTLYLVAGRFIWGSASDTVEVYMVPEDLTLGSPVSWYTTAANVDQSLFDTLSVGSKAANPGHEVSEIRLGATFDEVMGVEPPPSGTMIMVK